MAANTKIHYTVPGIAEADARRVIELLQSRLHALNDLHLTLKHVHWNVVGPHFIAVHEMIDPQVEAERDWADYSIGRAGTQEHLGALDVVYNGVIGTYRAAIDETDKLDLVTQDMLIGQVEQLELFHWFIRAHLEDQGGNLATSGAETEVEGATASRETS